jgi:hypothetical protein
MGVGTGATLSGADPVTFDWKSSDGGVSGTLSARLSGGKTYRGQFFRLEPLWTGKRGHMAGANWDDPVVADFGAPSGDHMRCTIHLTHPLDGMAGGARGQCQMPGGNTIDASFPKA